jgi:cation:H+ antiporter
VGAWLAFATCAVVIVLGGVFLTRYGDAIADKTGLGGSWVGLVLVATVTSLPELVSGVSAVTVAAAPDVAVGNVLGACTANLLILALLDFLKRGVPVYASVGNEHVLTAGLSILLLGVAGVGLALGHGGLPFARGLGFHSALLVLFYFVAIAVIHQYQRRHVAAFTDREPDAFPALSLRQVTVRYAAAAAVVVAAGIWLPLATVELAALLGWHQGFAGTVLAALVTTLPELVVTLTALRLGAIDMAVGSLLGSNLFNVILLAVDDAAYTPGPLLAAVAPAHLVTAMFAMTMTGTALVALYYRSRQRWLRRGDWPSLLLAVLYLVNVSLMYQASRAA